MTPRRIGILGGMGPEATILLMQRLIAAVPAADDAGHIPLIVEQNTQVPSRIAFLLEGRGADPGPELAAMARRLEAAGAEALAMACNTAHHFAPSIKAAVKVPFIDMVGLSALRAQALAGPGAAVGILGSPAVRQVRLFETALAARGLSARYPADEAALLAAIRSIKSGDPNDAARAALAAASAELAGRGARVQMIACTEFSLIADTVVGPTVFDTLDTLVAAIVSFALA